MSGTVKIQMTHELSGMPFDFDAVADTGIPEEEWNTMTYEQQDAVCQPLIAAWVKTFTETNWEIVDE